MKKRFVPAVLVSCVLAGNVAGQVETAAQLFATTRTAMEWNVVAMLRSAKSSTVAWAGFLAAQLQLTACIPELRKALAKSAGVERVPGALLDALIQTNAIVPGVELEPFGAGPAAIVLASRRLDQNRVLLLRGFHQELALISDERRACGNLLASLRDGAFARELLSSPIQLWVWVTDPGAKVEVETLNRPIRYCPLIGRAPDEPEGYPPVACYEFGCGAEAGGLLVAPGSRPVFAQRSLYRAPDHYQFDGYGAFHEARLSWLEQMLGTEQREVILAVGKAVSVEWKDRAALEVHAEQMRPDIEKRWRALVAACVAAKLLTVDPATEPLPTVTFFYVDDRTDRKVALPMNLDEW
jgi:hypothetical protein